MPRQKLAKLDLPRQYSLDETRGLEIRNTIETLPSTTTERRASPRSRLSAEMFNRAKTTLYNLGDVWKHHPTVADTSKKMKSKKQTTFDYFLKSKGRQKNDVNSVVGNLVISPHRLLMDSENGNPLLSSPSITRRRPATVSGERTSAGLLDFHDLDSDRPRKKLSFREPEILGYAFQRSESLSSISNSSRKVQIVRSVSEVFHRSDSYEDEDLENQAMRIVRTVGQAFEVCHKSTTGENTTSPEPPETTSLTNEPEVALSERESEKNINEHLKDCNSLDEHTNKEIPRLTQQDIVNTTTDSETIASNMISRDSSSSQTLEPPKLSSSSSPLMGRSLSTHHEVQLLKEQLEQQTQQTQAAIAQIQLLQDQLSAERAARLEAQTRTHQLLIHNRELLDHITALVSHLQDCERAQVPSQSKVSDVVPPHLTCVPQQICDPNSPYFGDYGYLSTSPDSPLRKSTPTGNIFAFNSITPEQNIQAQIMQQLANIGVYGSPQANNFGQFQYQPQIGQTYQNIYNQQLNNNNNVLQPPSKKKLPPSPLTLRQTFSNPYDPYSGISGNSDMFSNLSSREYSQLSKSLVSDIEKNQNLIKPLSQVGTLTTTDEEGRVRLIVPVPAGDNDKVVESLVTLKITDEEGNKRFVNGPPCITRSTSEKVPNKSELMSQVQRTTWARHTTK